MEIVKKGLEKIQKKLPVIPTIDVVVFPHMIVPLLVIDDRIIKGINQAIESNKLIFLLSSKNQQENQSGAISTTDLYDIGTIATVMRVVQIPEGGVKILVQGIAKAKVHEINSEENILTAHLETLENEADVNEQELEALIRNIKTLAEQMCENGQSLSPDFNVLLAKMTDPDKIADFIVSHLNLNVEQSQHLLELRNHQDLLEAVYSLLQNEAEVSEVQERIRNSTRESMNKSQKEYFLREQLRAIKKELGEDDAEDIESMLQKLDSLKFNEEARAEVKRQINRLEKTAPDSMEATVLRNYLDWMFSLPWGIETQDNLDLNHAREVLDDDHFGLTEIKDRILDFISVRKLKEDVNTPILCFVGPPGTG